MAMTALYYVENVWELPRPKLLISVTGGAQDFALSRAKENVLYKLMEAARQTDAWIVTGGTDAGIMKYVGEPYNSAYL
jgi:transient receptor potential cation channel subfamily M protein 2